MSCIITYLLIIPLYEVTEKGKELSAVVALPFLTTNSPKAFILVEVVLRPAFSSAVHINLNPTLRIQFKNCG